MSQDQMPEMKDEVEVGLNSVKIPMYTITLTTVKNVTKKFEHNTVTVFSKVISTFIVSNEIKEVTITKETE